MKRAITSFLLSLVCAGAECLAQSTIELRSAATPPPSGPVVLSAVAMLSGADAAALGDVVIVPEGSTRPARVTIQEVRRALASRAGVNWGRITMRGASCTLVAPVEAARPKPQPVSVVTPISDAPDSVRAAVAERIARLVQAAPADLRLSFDPDDAEVLNLSISGRTLEIKPTASSDKLPLALTLYEGDRIVASKSIRVGVLVKKSVVIAAAAKSRGETIHPGDVTVDEQWVGPNVKAAAVEMVVGATAQNRIATGQIIGPGEVAPAVIVAKGEQVAVSCVSGSIVLTTKARAMSAGRLGEVIKFQGLEDKRVFEARMSGKGRAVVVATGAAGPEAMP